MDEDEIRQCVDSGHKPDPISVGGPGPLTSTCRCGAYEWRPVRTKPRFERTMELADDDVVVSVAVRIGPLHRTNGSAWMDGLDQIAEQMTAYFAQNIEAFADQRGGDTFVALSVQRGEESAGHEYRSGHFVKEDKPS